MRSLRRTAPQTRWNEEEVKEVIVQSKISDARKQCDQAIRQVADIRKQLAGM